ncbi:MAG: diguanylate cyclase [Candidatus Sericytochromatia bacterium]|nr:diguanylate cyclase [Candidatus Sericytochromatia bacterium]
MSHVRTQPEAIPLVAGFFFALTTAVGVLAFAWFLVTSGGLVAWLQAVGDGQGWADASRGTLLTSPTFQMLVAMGLIAELTHIPLPKGGRMTAGFLIGFATLLMLGLEAAVGVVALVNILTMWVPPRRGVAAGFFNTGQLALAYAAANWALTQGHVYIYGYPGADDQPYVAGAAVAFLAVNFLVVDTHLGLQRRAAPWRILWEDDRAEIFVTLAMTPMAFLMAYMHQVQGWGGTVFVLLPVLLAAYGVRLYFRLKRSEAELAEYNQQLTILQQVATRISSQIELAQTLSLITQEMRQVVGHHESLIFLVDGATGMLVQQATSGAKALQLPLEHGLLGEVARERRSARVDDLAAGHLDVGVLAGFRSLLAVPVATDQEVLGVIAVLHQNPGAFDGGTERLLDILASQAAVAIKNAQLYRATQQLAVTDGLTQVYNRRYFEEQLRAELERARRQQLTTSLVVLDVDHFKKFNDTHGHLLGDQVLQGVARILLKSVRETDMVARYGGEEFVVILPETPPAAAVEVAERIRRNIKSHPFWGRGQTPLEVTASLGVCADLHSVLEAHPLFEQADRCLYQAKAEGRDRVCQVTFVADQPTEILTSRQERPKDPTVRRKMRTLQHISTEEWERYLRGNFEATLQAWWEEPAVHGALEGGKAFWGELTESFVEAVLRKLNSTEDERNGWLERFQAFPVYRDVQAELGRLIQTGVSITAMETAILSLYKRTQSLIQGAPFPLEERITVGIIQERLFHVLQLMVSQVWHDFFQATVEHLDRVAELEARLGPLADPAVVMRELAQLTARAVRADACLVLQPDPAGEALDVISAWGLHAWQELPPLPVGASLSGHCYTTVEACVVGDVHADPRLNESFHRVLETERPVRAALMLPLATEGAAVGVLYCLSEHLHHFTPLDARLGHTIAARLGLALARRRREANQGQGRVAEALSLLREDSGVPAELVARVAAVLSDPPPR